MGRRGRQFRSFHDRRLPSASRSVGIHDQSLAPARPASFDPSGFSDPPSPATDERRPASNGPLAHDDAEFDSIEEVDAVARTLRRVALQYACAVIAIFLAVPLLSLLSPWWSSTRVWGGFTPNFLTVAVGLHIVLVLVGLLYNRDANRSEDEMLGRPEDIQEWADV